MTQPPPPQQPSQAPQAVAVAAAAALTAATLAAALSELAPVAALLAVRRDALTAALQVARSFPPEAEGFHGPAGAQVARLNLARRAAFLVASARRLSADFRRAASGQDVSLAGVITRERRFYGQHLEAGWNRTRAAAQADSASMLYGPLLGWYTMIDSKTSAECLAANRRNFRADRMPAIGFPGMVHPHCRCLPGLPFPGAALVGAARVADRGRPVPDHRPLAGAAVGGVRR